MANTNGTYTYETCSKIATPTFNPVRTPYRVVQNEVDDAFPRKYTISNNKMGNPDSNEKHEKGYQ